MLQAKRTAATSARANAWVQTSKRWSQSQAHPGGKQAGRPAAGRVTASSAALASGPRRRSPPPAARARLACFPCHSVARTRCVVDAAVHGARQPHKARGRRRRRRTRADGYAGTSSAGRDDTVDTVVGRGHAGRGASWGAQHAGSTASIARGDAATVVNAPAGARQNHQQRTK